jgi:hypothetical protein
MPKGVRIDKKKAAAALRRSMGNITLAAKEIGCSRPSLSILAGKDPGLKEILDDSRDSICDHAESALNRAVVKGEPWAIQFTLRTLGRKRGYDERWEAESLRKRMDAIENELYKKRPAEGGQDSGEINDKQEIPPPSSD